MSQAYVLYSKLQYKLPCLWQVLIVKTMLHEKLMKRLWCSRPGDDWEWEAENLRREVEEQ